MSALQPLIDHIVRSLDDSGRWSVTVDEIARLLSIDETALYGRLYRDALRQGSRVALTDQIYNPETAGELVALLEAAGPAPGASFAEHELTRAGLFLPHSLRVELQERLIRQFVRDLVIHPPDIMTFDAMLRSSPRVENAVHLYMDEFFPLEASIREAAHTFAEDGGFSNVMASTAVIYLSSLFARHILDRETLLSPLVRLLLGRARDTGYIRSGAAQGEAKPSGGRASSYEAGTDEDTASELRSARNLFDLKSDEISLSSIRQKYKQLIRKFHPDINPAGLEMSKRINVSYALLLESIKG